MAKRKKRRRGSERRQGSGVEIIINRDGSQTVRHFGKPVNFVALLYEQGWRPKIMAHLPLYLAAGEYVAREEGKRHRAAERKQAKAAKAAAKLAKGRPAESELLPLAQIAKRLPAVRGGKPPSRSTLYRWATAGLKGATGERVKLKTARIGGTICTSLADVATFFDALRSVESQSSLPYTKAELADMKRRAAKATQRMKELGYL